MRSTTIQEGAVKVSPAPVTVDARTTIAEGAVKLDAPTTNNIAQPAAVVVKAYPMETEETIERDANGEIKRACASAKD
jgi:hypothetical protein